MRRRYARVHLPGVDPGVRRAHDAGEVLTCAVLAVTADEWIGADLATGALLRVRVEDGPAPADGDGLSAREASEQAPVLESGEVATITLGEPEPLRDPARPEGVELAGPPVRLGPMRPRTRRRLAKRLAAPEHSPGVVLARPGPSFAYVDLAPDAPSVAIIATRSRELELSTNHAGDPVVSIAWSGVTQTLPLLDAAAARAARAVAPRALSGKELDQLLGFRIGYCLVGLGAVRAAQAPKVCFALLGR